ncbi:MAG: hypothetical protein ABGX84_06880 [Alcanivorax sp.]
MRNMKTVPYASMFTLSAPSPKWVWNAQGQLVEIPAGQPAWDHDPVTGEPLGQRIEPLEALNLAKYSEDFMQWQGASEYYNITNNVGGAPDGGDYQTIEKPGQVGVLTSEITAPAGPAVVRLWFKNPQGFTGDWAFLLRNRDTASNLSYFLYVDSSGGTSGPAEVEQIGGWMRATFYYDGSGHSEGDRMILYANAGPASGGSLDIWGYEYVPGVVASSYIPTAGVAAIRAADVATIENVGTAAWFNENAFSIFLEAQVAAASLNGFFSVSPASGTEYAILFRAISGGIQALQRFEGSTRSTAVVPTDLTKPFRVAAAVTNGGELIMSVNGSPAVVLEDAAVAPGQTIINFGRGFVGSGPSAAMTVQGFRSFKYALTASELQELTQ